MQRISRAALFAVIVLVLFYFVWQKLHIGIFIHLSLFQALLLFGLVAVVIFFVIDHFINGRRG